MNDPFLQATGVSNEASAMTNAIASAFGRNRIYEGIVDDETRTRLRCAIANLMRAEARAYTQAVSDEEHCAAVRRIAASVSQQFGCYLAGGRFRYGTSQKAFNLYLKFLWRLGQILPPPHCPVDRVVLTKGGIEAAWTRSDSEQDYKCWINRLRWQARPLSLAEWEYKIWQDGAGHSSACGAPCGHAKKATEDKLPRESAVQGTPQPLSSPRQDSLRDAANDLRQKLISLGLVVPK